MHQGMHTEVLNKSMHPSSPPHPHLPLCNGEKNLVLSMKVRRVAIFLIDVWYTWHGLFHVNSDSDTGVCFEKCGPLHSNRGVWHLYINVQPSSWCKRPKMLLSVCGDVASFTSPETLAVCRTKCVAPFTIIQTCRINVWKHGPPFATTAVSVCSSMARGVLTEICGVSAHREKQGAPHQQRYVVSVYKNIASSLTSVVSQQRRAWVTGMEKHSSLHDDRVAASAHEYKKISALHNNNNRDALAVHRRMVPLPQRRQQHQYTERHLAIQRLKNVYHDRESQVSHRLG